jgi:hypothetical protein
MNQELMQKLYKEFPLLYGDRTKSMRETCMCWGIDTGDGWYKLIYDLSSKLEPLISKHYKDNIKLIGCSTCGCSREEHYGSGTSSPGKCLAVRRHNTKHIYARCGGWGSPAKLYYAVKQKIVNVINKISGLFYYKLSTCWCESFDPYIPRASQVKEKFGTLRFYMTCGTEEMDLLIDVAEAVSEITCEVCGLPGVLRNDYGWFRTLCDTCAVRKDGTKILPNDEFDEEP